MYKQYSLSVFPLLRTSAVFQWDGDNDMMCVRENFNLLCYAEMESSK